MSRLKDIMDVDVEPLESQAHRRSKETAQYVSGPFNDQSSPTLSSSVEGNQEKASMKRRRPNRVSKSTSHFASSRASIMQQLSNSAGEVMGFAAGYPAGPSDQASTPGSSYQSSSRGSEPTPDIPVKYTPVTGRISKAKKGTFTRAEHLRRHQLSHENPAYPCTFRGCDRAFHRPDLLARHLQRHEIQGEKPYKSPGSRSRSSSSGSAPSDYPTPLLSVATPPQNSSAKPTPPAGPNIPRTSASVERSTTTFSTVTSSLSHERSSQRSTNDVGLATSEPFPSAAPDSGISHTGPSTFAPHAGSNMPGQDNFSRDIQHDLTEMYTPARIAALSHSSQSLSLQIPDDTNMPGLSHTQENSPWCSSASDSNYSTHSDGSRTGGQWSGRARSDSAHTVPNWPAAAPQFPTNAALGTPHDLQSPQFESPLEQFLGPYVSPRMTRPSVSQQLLDVTNSLDPFYMDSVGTPTLSIFSKPLASVLSESTSRVSESRLAGVDVKTKQLMEPQLEALYISATMAHLAPLEPYISSYWQLFDAIFPVIHRGSFDPTANIILSSAMAAIGTQYHSTAAARQKGIELNDYCRKTIDHFPHWDLHTMQAILLTEAFTRYRGRKVNIKLSRQFEQVYNRLLDTSSQDPIILHGQNVTFVAPATALDHSDTQSTMPRHAHHSDPQSEWVRWIDIEGRQRLLAFCFMFDTHQSLYHEQNRSIAYNAEVSSRLFLPCSENIWNAMSALDWQAQYAGYAPQPLHQVEQDLKSIANGTLFMHGLVICSFASRLPARDDLKYPNKFSQDRVPLPLTNLGNLFPSAPWIHIYLALYHTPLHDLLAIAGDTWVFGKKITPPSAFHSAQSRLKAWCSSPNAAAATHHACRHLTYLLTQPYTPRTSSPGPSFSFLSDYWAYYVSALICWAFGTRHHSAHPSSNTISRSNSSTAVNTGEAESFPSGDQARSKALKYVSAILEFAAEDLLTPKAHMRGDTASVIVAVREHLEVDALGSKCMMLVDAVHVLTQIREGGKGKWFR